jgi:hypothetical protein
MISGEVAAVRLRVPSMVGLLFVGHLVVACRGEGDTVRGGRPTLAPNTSAEGTGAASPAFDANIREPLALMRIAESHRVGELIAMAEGGGAERTAALLALAYADDVELVLARLSLLALDPKRDDRETVLAVLRDVAYRRPRDRERLAPESLAACIANLRRLAADTKEAPELRALAETSVTAFERNGLVAKPAAASASAPKIEASSSVPTPSASVAPP